MDRARSSYISPFDLALCFAGLRDTKSVLKYLEQAYLERVMRVISIGDPELDDVRFDSRFVLLVQKLGIPT